MKGFNKNEKIYKKVLSLILVSVLSLCFNLTFALNEKRQIVVDYMSEMANVVWDAENNIWHWNLSCVPYVAGVTYYGIPYSQFIREVDLIVFNRLLMGGYYEGINLPGRPEIIVAQGSDCSSAVSMAWQQIDPAIPYLSTYNMIPTSDNLYNIVKVGYYSVPLIATTSTEIISLNKKETMFLAYSNLQPGDAVVRRTDKGGHVILVKEVDLVNNRIIGIEQTGVNECGCLKGKDGHSSWNDNRILTFDYLYDNAYIPITIKELVDKY